MIKLILMITLLSQPTGKSMDHVFVSTMSFDTMEQCETFIHTNENAVSAQQLSDLFHSYDISLRSGQFKCVVLNNT